MPTKRKNVERTHVTPRDICDSVGLGIETVLGWIHSGELKASNIAKSSLRPRWRIEKVDLKAFLDARSNQAASKSTKPARRRSKPSREYV